MDTEQFIECVKKYPVLYNTRHKDFKNALRKAEIWEVIATKMNQNSEALRVKWKGLKDGYTKHKKQDDKGSAKNYRNWCWGQQLTFLDDFPSRNSSIRCSRNASSSFTPSTAKSPSPTRSPLESPYESETSQDFLEKTASTTTAPKALKRRAEEDIEELLDFMQNKRTKKTDAVDHLFMSYAETFKKFTVRTQTKVKVQMAKLFADAELEEDSLNQLESPVYAPTVNSVELGLVKVETS